MIWPWLPRLLAHTGAMGTTPPAVPAPLRLPSGCDTHPASCSTGFMVMMCPFVTLYLCHQLRGANAADSSVLNRGEARAAGAGAHSSPRGFHAFPEIPPGGTGLFVLRIWVKIVRCFADVGMRSRYFGRKRGWWGEWLNVQQGHPPQEGAETSGSRSASAGTQGHVSWHVALPQGLSPLPH